MYRVIVLFYGLIVLYKWDRSFHVVNFSSSAFSCSLFKVMSRYMSGHVLFCVRAAGKSWGLWDQYLYFFWHRGSGPVAGDSSLPLHSDVCGGDSFTRWALLPDLGGAQRHPPSGLLWATSSHFSGSTRGPYSLSPEPVYQNSRLPLMPNGGVKEYRQPFLTQYPILSGSFLKNPYCMLKAKVFPLASFWYRVLAILQADRCFRWNRLAGGMCLERWKEKCMTHFKVLPCLSQKCVV